MASIEDFVFDQFKFDIFPSQPQHNYGSNTQFINENEEQYLSQHNLQQQQFYAQQKYAFNQGGNYSQDSLFDIDNHSYQLYAQLIDPLIPDLHSTNNDLVYEPKIQQPQPDVTSHSKADSKLKFELLQGQSIQSKNMYPQVDTSSPSPNEPQFELLATVNTQYPPIQQMYIPPPCIPYNTFNLDAAFESSASSFSDEFSPMSSTSSYSPPSSNDFSGSVTKTNTCGYPKYRVTRGISSGGTATKPPKLQTLEGFHFRQVELRLNNAKVEDMCLPEWNELEKEDKRRIIRLERYQVGNKIICDFKILGSAEENPQVCNENINGVDVVEVSCLEAFNKPSDDMDDEDLSSGSESDTMFSTSAGENIIQRSFYITSVEVIKIVELLVGVESQDMTERRRERGRIRSNLVPFWSKRPISSRMSSGNSGVDSNDFRVELASRIMGYETRKPRGFDKEVRILKWEKLFKALKRALQSYYVEVPEFIDEDELEDDK